MRFKNIDVLRGIASLSVAYFHLSGSAGLSKQIANTGKFGYLGVEVFFVISGFILPYSMSKKGYTFGNFFKFLGKRVLRIDPPYIAIILISLILFVLTKRPWPDWKPLLLHLGYLNGVFGYDWIAPVFWTLALEFQFYLLLALTFNLIASKNNFISIISIAVVISSAYFISSSFLPHWFGFFALGILLFRKLYFKMSDLLYWMFTLILTLFICYINGIPEAIVGLSAVLFILFLKVEKDTIIAKIGLWFGTISYSLYLVHWELGRTGIAIFRHVPYLGEHEIYRLIFGVLFSILTAWIFYKLFEKPALKLSTYIKY